MNKKINAVFLMFIFVAVFNTQLISVPKYQTAPHLLQHSVHLTFSFTSSDRYQSVYI